ncbi:MAG TPA: helix-turn-helix domain-containing protein [Pseudonocardia sp.]
MQRAFELLEAMADAGGRVGLSELAVRVDLPKQNPQRPHTDPALRANPLRGRHRLSEARSRILGRSETGTPNQHLTEACAHP